MTKRNDGMNLPAESVIGNDESPKSGNQLCRKTAICMLHIVSFRQNMGRADSSE